MYFSPWLLVTLFLISFVSLTGCATHTYGTSAAVNESSLSQIHAGTSTAADLRRVLGEPTETESLGPGLELWTYRYVEYRGTYVPLIGPVSTGEGWEGIVKFHVRDNRVERLERSQTRRSSGF
ncbi:hypothetical protein CCP3SC1_130018 [Gammaproteobacteria bacterium]